MWKKALYTQRENKNLLHEQNKKNFKKNYNEEKISWSGFKTEISIFFIYQRSRHFFVRKKKYTTKWLKHHVSRIYLSEWNSQKEGFSINFYERFFKRHSKQQQQQRKLNRIEGKFFVKNIFGKNEATITKTKAWEIMKTADTRKNCLPSWYQKYFHQKHCMHKDCDDLICEKKCFTVLHIWNK
jgi:hypothetical protein